MVNEPTTTQRNALSVQARSFCLVGVLDVGGEYLKLTDLRNHLESTNWKALLHSGLSCGYHLCTVSALSVPAQEAMWAGYLILEEAASKKSLSGWLAKIVQQQDSQVGTSEWWLQPIWSHRDAVSTLLKKKSVAAIIHHWSRHPRYLQSFGGNVSS